MVYWHYDEYKLDNPFQDQQEVIKTERCGCCGDGFEEDIMERLGFVAYGLTQNSLVCPECLRSLKEEYKQ